MPYRIWGTDDVPSDTDMDALTADPAQASIDVTEGPRASATYGNLTTVGPTFNLTLVSTQTVLMFVSFVGLSAVDAAAGFAAAAISGASSRAAADGNAAHYFSVKVGTSTSGQAGRPDVYTAANPGTHTATVQYRGNGTDNVNFGERRLTAKKY